MKNIKLRIVYLILGAALLLFALFMLAVNVVIPAHFVSEAEKALRNEAQYENRTIPYTYEGAVYDDDWDDGAEEHFFTPSIVFLELENGYQPNKQAKGLAEQKTNTLLFVYENTPDNPFFTELIRGAIDGAKEAHQILLFNIICDSYVTDYFLNALRSDQIDGVIVASTGLEETRNFAKMVASEGRHLVLINDPIGELNVPRIYINNDQSAYQATRHLLECGHTRIGHIGGRTTSYPSYQRFEGYSRAMTDAGLRRYVDRYTIMDNTNREEARAAAKKLLAKKNRPTAIFCANDSLAFGVCAAVSDVGLRVPNDVSVVGYDDIAMASTFEPKLTTIHQPIYEMGRRSIQLMLHQTQSGGTGIPESVVLSASLVKRESVRNLL